MLLTVSIWCFNTSLKAVGERKKRKKCVLNRVATHQLTQAVGGRNNNTTQKPTKKLHAESRCCRSSPTSWHRQLESCLSTEPNCSPLRPRRKKHTHKNQHKTACWIEVSPTSWHRQLEKEKKKKKNVCWIELPPTSWHRQLEGEKTTTQEPTKNCVLNWGVPPRWPCG